MLANSTSDVEVGVIAIANYYVLVDVIWFIS